MRLQRDLLARTNSGGLQALTHHHIAPVAGDGVVALVGTRPRAVEGDGEGEKLAVVAVGSYKERSKRYLYIF